VKRADGAPPAGSPRSSASAFGSVVQTRSFVATLDLRVTLFPRFRIDEVGTAINSRSIFAGRRQHIVHMDGLSLGMDGSRAFFSPLHVELVDDVDELERLDGFLDIVPQTDPRVPPRVLKRLMSCGPLGLL
jgi:hypothetical protein